MPQRPPTARERGIGAEESLTLFAVVNEYFDEEDGRRPAARLICCDVELSGEQR